MEQRKCTTLHWIFIIQVFGTMTLFQNSKGQEQLRLSVHQGYTELKWSPIAMEIAAIKYKVFYQVLSTSFHSIIDTPPGVYEVNITTTDYPGSMYIVRLYSFENGSNHTRIAATRTFRAGCNYKFSAGIGDAFTIKSPGYPNGYHGGVLCYWSFMGLTDLWYRITMIDFRLPSRLNCSSYLNLVGYKKYCHSGSYNKTTTDVVTSNNLNLQFYGRKSGKGFMVNITAIPMLRAPQDVTAVSIGQFIHVNWTKQNYTINNVTYMLKIRAPPSGNETVVELPGETSQYDIDTVSHQGQAFSIRILANTPYGKSEETAPVIVRSGCHHDVIVQGHTEKVIVSPGYPRHILPNVICNWSVSTSDNFYLKFAFNDVKLTDDFDSGCKETYLEIWNYGRKCNLQHNPYDLVVKNNSAELSLHTGTHVKGQGFNITVKAVAKPTDPPHDIHVTVNTSHININWKSPDVRSQEIINYVLRYDVMPDTPNMEINTNDTFASISTRENRGRMFIIRLASETDGGRSKFSKLQYVRAACGITSIISHKQSMMIFAPTYRGSYRPGVVCKWDVATHKDMLLKITIDRLDIEKSPLCTKDYLQISKYGRKLCGYHQNNEILVQSNTTDIMFLSDFSNQLTGFILTVTSVAPPPGKPEKFNVMASPNALVLSWKPLDLRHNYLTGYIVQYRLISSTNFTQSRVPTHQNFYVINTENTPGVLYELTVRGDGESEPGPTTGSVIQRSHCGYSVSNLTEPLYITTPNYPSYSKSGTVCEWHIHPESDVYLTIMEVNVKPSLIGPANVSDYINGCLKITGIQNTSVLINRHVLINDKDVRIYFNTSAVDIEGGFLLQLLSTKIDNISEWFTGNYSTSAYILRADVSSDKTIEHFTWKTQDLASHDFWYTLPPSITSSFDHFNYSNNDSVALHGSFSSNPLDFGATTSSFINGLGYVGYSPVFIAPTRTLMIDKGENGTSVSFMDSLSSHSIYVPGFTDTFSISSASFKSELSSFSSLKESEYLSTIIRNIKLSSLSLIDESNVEVPPVHTFPPVDVTSFSQSKKDAASVMIDKQINQKLNTVPHSVAKQAFVVGLSDSFFGHSVFKTNGLTSSDSFCGNSVKTSIVMTPSDSFSEHSVIKMESSSVFAKSDLSFERHVIETSSVSPISNSFKQSVIEPSSISTSSDSYFKESLKDLETLTPSYSDIFSINIKFSRFHESQDHFSKLTSLNFKDNLETIDFSSIFENKIMSSFKQYNPSFSSEVSQQVNTDTLKRYLSSDIMKNELTSGSIVTRRYTSQYIEDSRNGGTSLKQSNIYIFCFMIIHYISV